MIKLGDRITVKPATFDVPGKDGKPKGVPGTVVYKRQDKSRKQAPHRAVNRRQPKIPRACAKRHEANGRCHGRFYEPVPQKVTPRQNRRHSVRSAKNPCQNHPPPTKLLAAKPRAAHKKSRIDDRVQKKQSLPAKLHPLLPFPVSMDKV